MKALYIVLLALFAQTILATLYPNKSTLYGCPDECSTEEDPKCDIPIPSNKFFVAVHPKYFPDNVKPENYPLCGHYYVGMIIDEKADGKYKLVRGKVVDECGTCHEKQVDLSQPMFETIAKKKTGVVKMVYVILDKDSSEIKKGPVYNDEDVSEFAKRVGASKNDILESFKQAAKNMNQNGEKGMSEYPWVNGSSSKKTTSKKTTTTTSKKTTTTTSKKTTTTTTSKKTTTTTKKTTVETIKITTAIVKTVSKETQPTISVDIPIEKEPTETEPTETVVPVPITPEEGHIPEHVPEAPAKKPEENVVEDKIDDEDHSSPVTAGVIAVSGVGCAAAAGLLLLKRKSPQKYNELKRSLSRGASTIKRGVTRSVSRRGTNPKPTPLPASYSFTLNTEDGLPRVALYDDPYPTKTRGTQHW